MGSDDESISKNSSNQDDMDGNKSEEEKSVSESDILAELNANLAKIAEKDKAKTQARHARKPMFAVTVDDPEIEPEPQIELKIHPSLLLKPTDVPQHVIDEKKLNITSNKQKAESSEQSNAISLQHVEQLQQEQQQKEQQEQLLQQQQQQKDKTEKENNKNSALSPKKTGNN